VKQVLQSLRTGVTEVADVPAPGVRHGHALIRTSRSLVSAGTERMLVDFGKAGWISKALQQPEKVRMAYDKARTDGVVSTIEAVFNKLDQPLPLGYCNVGTVMAVGGGTTAIRPTVTSGTSRGDASGGGGDEGRSSITSSRVGGRED
jgi:hypothetical protein